jgi:outer membrane biosynthesis protein TonB
LGGGFPTERGADTLVEFERQRLKTLTSLLAMDADVIGLMEIENDGYGPDSALQDLINGLNDETAPGTYDFIEPSESLGTDAIRVALIYRPGNVTPVGAAAVLNEGPFGQYRPALAQTFQHNESGEVFTVAVNHFKSKSCSGAGGENADQGDGQGCFNASRVEAAEVLSGWLAGDPTGSGDPDILIIGDLNAYAMEDPITTLIDAGYVNLIMQFAGDEAYSYVFSGQSGYLDHALATESLAAQTVNVLEWHINSDEPRTLDYNTEFKSPAQVQSLFAPDPFRASDHDPVIIDLQLGAGDRIGTQEPEITPEETAAAIEETPAVDVTETVAAEPTESAEPTEMVEAPEETSVEVAQVNTPTAAVEVTDAVEDVEDEEATETPEADETETAEPTEDEAEPTEDAEATATEEADDATPEATPVVDDGEAGDDAADDGDTDNTGLIALIVAVIAVIVGAVGFFLNQGRRDGTTPPASGR